MEDWNVQRDMIYHQFVHNCPYLLHIARCAQQPFERIIMLACMQPKEVNRARAYRALGRLASHVVGWGAQQEELQTSQHYQALLGLIDALLDDCVGNDDIVGFSPQEWEQGIYHSRVTGWQRISPFFVSGV